MSLHNLNLIHFQEQPLETHFLRKCHELQLQILRSNYPMHHYQDQLHHLYHMHSKLLHKGMQKMNQIKGLVIKLTYTFSSYKMFKSLLSHHAGRGFIPKKSRLRRRP